MSKLSYGTINLGSNSDSLISRKSWIPWEGIPEPSAKSRLGFGLRNTNANTSSNLPWRVDNMLQRTRDWGLRKPRDQEQKPDPPARPVAEKTKAVTEASARAVGGMSQVHDQESPREILQGSTPLKPGSSWRRSHMCWVRGTGCWYALTSLPSPLHAANSAHSLGSSFSAHAGESELLSADFGL